MGPGFPWAPPRLSETEIAAIVTERVTALLTERDSVLLAGEDAKLVRSVMVDEPEAPVTHLPTGYHDRNMPAEILRQNVRDLLGEEAAAPAPEPVPAPEPTPEPAAAVEPEPAPIPEPTPAPELNRFGNVRLKVPSIAVEDWLNDEAIDDPDGRVIVATSADVYARWAADKPNHPDTISSLTVAKALKGRGYKRKAPLINGRQYPAYYGVRLRYPEAEPDGSIRQTVEPEKVQVVERFVTARTRPTDKPEALVATAEMYASYQRWCERTGQPDVGSVEFSTAMQQLGAYRKGQLWSGPRKKILGYLGAELTPEPLAGEKRQEVPTAAEVRAAIAKAKAALPVREESRDEPEVTYRVKSAESEVKPNNNGWGKTFDTSNTVLEELTRADVLAEHAESKPRGGYKGPRPAPGDQLDGETRDLINGLLNLDLGWEFIPASGANNPKTYVVAPDGSRFRQASSMGGSEGRVGNNRYLRRYLSKKGYLPTAAAPVSQLTKPQPKVVTKKAEEDNRVAETIKVIRANGQVQTSSEWIKVEADPDAPPLTEEQMEAELFDVYTDVKDGMVQAFTYHPDVESLHGLDREGIENAVRHPERVEVRPESKTKGYPVIKFARGDVNVIMGFRDRNSPAVIRAEWGWLLGHDTYHVDRHGGGGSKTAAGSPTSSSGVCHALRKLGAKISPDKDGKTAVVSYKDQELGQITLGKAPRETHTSDWNRMQRKIQAISRRELARV